jgi:hypothetical protein
MVLLFIVRHLAVSLTYNHQMLVVSFLQCDNKSFFRYSQMSLEGKLSLIRNYIKLITEFSVAALEVIGME